MLSWLLIPLALALPSDVALKAIDGPRPQGLRLQASTLHWAGGTVVRFAQTLDGLPVLGPGPRVCLDIGGQVRAVHGQLLRQRPATRSPSLEPAEAITLAQDALFIDHTSRAWPGHARLAVYPVGEVPLVWAVDVARAQPFQTWLVLVDAIDGTIIHSELSSQTVTGTVFPRSPVHSDPTDVPLNNLTSMDRLLGTYAEALSCVDWDIDPEPFGTRDCLAISATAEPDHKGNYHYDPTYGALDDPFAEVQAYHHTDVISAWADERWGIRLSEPLRVLTNFPLTNAFYGDFDGDGVRDTAYGISDDGYNFAYDSDVVYHEYGHAIVRTIAGSMGMKADEIGIDWTSGSLNEGTADIFAMALNGDPLLAEYLGQSERWDTAIRDLEADRRCPEDLQSEVHRNGEILASLGWNLIEALGQENAAELLVGALGTWSSETSWSDAGRSLEDATAALREAGVIDERAQDEALALIQASGMPDCSRIIDLAQVQSASLYLLNLGRDDEYARFSTGVQFSLVAPPEAVAIELEIVAFDGKPEGTGWTIYIRAGEPVHHLASKVEGLGLPFAEPTEFDLRIDGANTRTIRLDAQSRLRLEPGEVYYFAIASRNLSRARHDIDYARISVSGRVLIGTHAAPQITASSSCSTLPPPQHLWLLLATLPIGLCRRKSTEWKS
jgi:hypothetical protein